MLHDHTFAPPRFLAGCIAIATAALISANAVAEPVKIGLQKLAGQGYVYLAKEKGYFAAESIDAEFVFFPQPDTIPLAIVSGDLDFGGFGLTATLYNLAGQGALRIIAPGIGDAPGFMLFAAIASNQASAAGLKSYKDLPGHSFAATTVGSATVYTLTLIAAKYGFNLQSVRVLALQSPANILSAISGGQADSSIIGATLAMPTIQNAGVKLIGYTGDEVPWQAGGWYAATQTTNERRQLVEHFVHALSKGRRDYAAAFIGQDGKPKDGATTPEVLATIAKYVGQSVDQVKLSISYIDPDGRMNVRDVLHQIDWYRSQGMVKGDFDPASIIDKRYVVPLP